MDIIDIYIEVTPIPFDKLSDERKGEPRITVRKGVIEARKLQTVRFEDQPNIHYNAQMSVKQIKEYCKLKNFINKSNGKVESFSKSL